ncbi:hypothetical protein [Maribacter litoralis]|uniref:DUF4168 domain-containing protein n=1 Tax=Maribacter litoralis TaxID=2059726 RepID=A0A653NZH1_9FLAO|nr:hypothetical protein [Maribacter litoralis]VXB22430.1 conserved exported hypothetical protein [Maribacter litoralis]
MKNKIVLTAALTLILASCSSTKKTSTNNTETTTEQVSTVQNTSTSSSSSEMDAEDSSAISQQNMAAQANGSTGAMNNLMAQGSSKTIASEYAEMFSKLEMSDEQISTFTSAMNRFKTKQANMPSGEMLGSIENERTRQLEEILSSGQYAKYEEWLANNQ